MKTIEIKGLDELNRKFKNLRSNKPEMEIAREIAQDLVIGMKSKVPFWHGNLQKSIQSRQTKSGYNIHMNFYWRFVEYGTAEHAVSPKAFLLRAWAMSKGLDFDMLRRTIMIQGTKAHPFVEPQIEETASKFSKIEKDGLTLVMRRSGFHG